ncbi:Delta(12)-fatty acid dehydrogenase [Reticulomyxa filosa]|uniref:Delta(12)-fatty acid dehydrogenase n=1 Tax=Reticulomyxa filosa TaxID=46433 RepID=X6MDK3_RETFI|nr:Delta(12)-fatty acid dehydrogenase [Reticulomyxa filosa]|eukprot:ETO11125.1 Delta(12)-fatty acid dehydrogenase [Reticulomyxa filosa]
MYVMYNTFFKIKLFLKKKKKIDQSKDPDAWSGHCSYSYLLPLKWSTQMGYYYCVYLPNCWNVRPWQEVSETLMTAAILVLFPLYRAVACNDTWLFSCFLVPALCAITYLAFVFDYLPHRPHQSKDIYLDTNVTALLSTDTLLSKEWNIGSITLPMLYQNYHNVHHLYPWIPFYAYNRVWWHYFEFFLSKGTQVKISFNSLISMPLHIFLQTKNYSMLDFGIPFENE